MKKLLLTSLSMLALMCPVMAQDKVPANTMAAKTMDMTMAKNEAEYRNHLMGLGSMSLMASQMAEEKAGNDKVKEFANFEVAEQTAIASVLKEMKTPKPPMSADDQAVMEKLKAASGDDFDQAYVQASLDTHNKLESLSENFLKSSKSDKMAEMHARHLATVTLPTIKQHIAQSKELMSAMK